MQIRQDKYNVIQSQSVQVKGKGSDVRLDLKLDFNTKQPNLGSTVSGTVVDSNNKPIQGAVVKLMDDKLQALTNATTDINGKYSIDSVPYSSMYNMIAIAPGKILSQATPFMLLSSQSTTVNFTLLSDENSTLGAISGTILDGSGKAISGAIVLLYSIVNGVNNLKAITYTDTSGVFVFSELAVGEYSITITALGYLQGSATANVQSGIITTISRILSVNPQAANGIVSGLITDSTNSPVIAADVILYSIDSNNSLTPLAFTRTNSTGIYTFINVPAGNYLVKSNQSQLVTVNTQTDPSNTSTFSTSTLPLGSYDVALGILADGAKLDSNTSYAGFLGGPTNGSSTVTITVNSAGPHNIAVKYIAADINRSMKLDVNGINTGTIYILPKTSGWTVNNALTFTIPVYLNAGNNTIKFHGDGFNYAPTLGGVTVNKAIIPTTTTISLGFMINGARVVSSGAAGFIGGFGDGSVFINYNAAIEGNYTLNIIGQGNNSKLLVDVNGVNTGNIYELTVINPATVATVSMTVYLNSGDNIIRFHGNGVDYGPDLFTAEFLISTSVTSVSSSLSSNEITFIGNNNAKINTLKFDTTSKKLIVTSTGTQAHSGLSNIKYFGVSLYDGNNNLKTSVFLNGQDNGNTFASLLNGVSFNYGDYLKVYHAEPIRLQVLGTVLESPIDLTTGFENVDFSSINLYIQSSGLKYAIVPSLSSYKITGTNILTVNAVTNGIKTAGILPVVNNTFVGAIGDNGDFVTLTVTIPTAGVYNLAVQYLSGDMDRFLQIDVNGKNTVCPYIATKTADWNVTSARTINAIATFASGNNTIKFYNNPNEKGPWVGNLTITKALSASYVYSTSATKGTISNGASLQMNNSFVGAIGDTGGTVIVTVTVPVAGSYDLDIQHLNGSAAAPFRMDINGVSTNTIYMAPKTDYWIIPSAKILTANINLNAGANTIKFYNSPNTPAPWIGNLLVKSYSVSGNNSNSSGSITGTINLVNGNILDGAFPILNNTFVGAIGDAGGNVIISVNVATSAVYNLAIQYISGDRNRVFRMDINNIPTGSMYTVNKTSGWDISNAQILNVLVNLNAGTNIIKFYNNSNEAAPWLGNVTISNPTPLNYNISSASLNSGAKVDSGGYVINNGGPANGYSILTVNVPASGIYTLNVNYRNTSSEKPLNIDINGANIGTSFTIPINNNGIFTTTIVLSEGRNRIKFYGEKSTNYSGLYAPDLMSCSLVNNELFSPNIAKVYSADYAMTKAQIFNGATLSSDNYVISQGGPSKGYSVLTVSVPYYGTYNLVLTRRNSEFRPLNIDINGVNTGTTYNIHPGIGKKYIIYDNVLNVGNNTIKFYGNGSNSYTPDLFMVNVVYTSASLPQSKVINYDISKAILGNGAFIDSSGYGVSNGGPNNGYTLFTIKVLKSGIYNLSINYRHYTTNRPLNIDVNNVNTGTIYSVPPAAPGTFKISASLTMGNNTIKFYGDGKGVNYTPDIKELILELVTPVPTTSDKYLTPNASTLPNIYQLRNIDMKYGMFIHFGINTFVDSEWTDGSINPSYYAPPSFEIERWAELAWEAGMNYIISITKHHDGFSVRDSNCSDYDAASSRNSLNVTKALAEACKKYGIKLGLYYSIWDRNWDARYDVTNNEVYIDYMLNQLTELLGGDYGDIVELWLDGSWIKDAPAWQVDKVYDTVKRLQPGCQVSTNWTIGGPAYINPATTKDGDAITYFPSDFRLGDPYLPNPVYDAKLYSYDKELYYLPFETTVCLKSTWFYNTNNDFEGPRQSPDNIKAMYTQLVNQKNNLVLNAGPNKEGKQLQNDVDTLYVAAQMLGIARGKALTTDILGSNLALNKTVVVSEEPYGASYAGSKVVDGDSNTRWATNDGTDAKWIEINFGQNTSFNRVIISEATELGMGMRITNYKLEYWNGTSYVVLNQGTTVGDNLVNYFSTISTNKIKFTCYSANRGPTIRAIEVFNVIKGKTLLPQKVRVEYRNENGYPIQASEVLYGNIGDSYTTQAKDLTKLGYAFKQVLGLPNGMFSQQEIVVTYVYKDLCGIQYYSTTYNLVALGTLLNGASLQVNNTFVGAIGDNGGYVTVSVNAPEAGDYYLDIKYLSGDKDRALQIAVNGVYTGTSYTAKKTVGWTQNDVATLRAIANLKAGLNIIKLYNDNNVAGPWISKLRTSLIFK